jgi:uncharacterized protein (TIGR02147 family)
VIYEHTSYRTFLRTVLADRTRSNPAYSLRAMARQLVLPPSQLSRVLGGHANLSARAARKVAHRLRLDATESEYLVALVELESEDSPEIRSALLDRLNRLRPNQRQVRDLQVDAFRQIADWHHCAILELALLPGFELSAESAARKLGISKLDAQVALERLERLELLVRTDERWTRPDQELKFTAPDRSAAMRSFYRQMMEKYSTALDEQEPFKERLSGFETMPMSRAALPELGEALEEFFEKASRIAKKFPGQSDVYHLGVHVINLTHVKKEKS